jgi:hypothetical protein
MDNELLELKDYLKNNFNINTTIKTNLDNPKYYSLYEPLINILILIIYFIALIILFINLEKIIKNNIINRILFIILILISLIGLILLMKYILIIVYNLKNNNNSVYNKIDINSFQTGDIIAEKMPIHNNRYGYNLLFFDFNTLHHILIIKYNNRIYGLHMLPINLTYPKKYLSFNDVPKNMELFLLEDYLNDNYYYIKNYKYFKIKIPIQNNNLFVELKKILELKIKFMKIMLPKISIQQVEKDNEYQCLSFILLLLINLKIIPKINVSTISPNDIEHILPELSKGLYSYEGSFSV